MKKHISCIAVHFRAAFSVTVLRCLAVASQAAVVAVVIVAIAMVTLSGCGPNRPATYPVTGKVVFPDGSTLSGGMVEFESLSADGQPVNARGPIAADGTFSLSTFEAGDGALPGEHKALVHPPMSDVDVEEGEKPPPLLIDQKFKQYKTSGLKFTIQEGENKITINVTRPGG